MLQKYAFKRLVPTALISNLLLAACIPLPITLTPEVASSTPLETPTSTEEPGAPTVTITEPTPELIPSSSPTETPPPAATETPLPAQPTLAPTYTPTPAPTSTAVPIEIPTMTPTATPQPTPTLIPLIPTPTVQSPGSDDGGASLSYSPSVIPHIFVGTASINGTNAAAGTVVAAWIGGNLAGTTTVQAGGSYSMAIGQVLGVPSFSGQTITFSIGPAPADQQSTWQSGGALPLNLTATQ